MSNLSETLLARLTNRTRAAAIMGDLFELSATRGRLYFWSAYLRTLISLTWRTPVAFLCGYAAFELMMRLIPIWIKHTPQLWRGPEYSPLVAKMGPLMAVVTVCLWFALPYGLVRYGRRDKFVQLAAASTLLASLIFFYPPVLSPIVAIVVAVAAIVVLASPVWRRAGIALVSTVAAGAATVAAIASGVGLAHLYFSEQLHPGRLIYRYDPPWVAIDLATLLIVALVCSRLHARLLDQPPSANSTLA